MYVNVPQVLGVLVYLKKLWKSKMASNGVRLKSGTISYCFLRGPYLLSSPKKRGRTITATYVDLWNPGEANITSYQWRDMAAVFQWLKINGLQGVITKIGA